LHTITRRDRVELVHSRLSLVHPPGGLHRLAALA